MKTGIRAHDVMTTGLENICKRCREINICYLQLVLEKAIENFNYGKFSIEYAISLKRQLGDTKIAVLGSYINPSNANKEECREELNKFKEKIKYASILKPIAVATETGIYKEGLTDSEEAYQYLLKNIKEIVLEAKKYGVSVAIEGVHCFVINTPQKMKRLIDDVNSDNLRVIFDPVNYLNINNYHNQNDIIEAAFELLSDKICVIHAKDFIVENGEFKGTKPMEGLLNYQLILEKIKEKNLDVPVITEEINEDDAVTVFERLDYLKNNQYFCGTDIQ